MKTFKQDIEAVRRSHLKRPNKNEGHSPWGAKQPSHASETAPTLVFGPWKPIDVPIKQRRGYFEDARIPWRIRMRELMLPSPGRD